MNLPTYVLAILLIALTCFTQTPIAYAQQPTVCGSVRKNAVTGTKVAASASNCHQTQTRAAHDVTNITSGGPAATGNRSTSPSSSYTGPTYEELLAQVLKHNTTELAHQQQRTGIQATCFQQGTSAGQSNCPYTPNLLPLPTKPTSQPTRPAQPANHRAAAPTITQHDVWEQVKTSLTLHAATPRVAPDFSIHHQRSILTGQPLDSVVGYPVWYWATDGDLTATTTEQKSHGMTVSLAMTPTGITVDPGDGQTIACPDNGTPWTQQIQAGTESPTCGHTYTKTGTYTLSMTTGWTVHYIVDNGTDTPLIGDETITATKTRPIRIGELQVLIVNH